MKFLCPVLLLILISGCDLFDHLQHMDAPEITGISPSDDIAELSSLERVSLKFSEEMDKKRTEDAFSLSENDEEMDGTFNWISDKKMSFTPYHGFLENREYKITLRKSAEDRWGNSLDQDFYSLFRTGEDIVPPFLISSEPTDFSVLDSSRTPLTLTFSESVDLVSFRNALEITPAIPMEQNWDDEGCSVTLTPLENYQPGEEYHLTLSDSLTDTARNAIVAEITLLFRTAEPGSLTAVSLTVDGSGAELLRESDGINPDLEKDLMINGILNRSPDFDERSSLISILPSKSFDLDWSPDFTSFSLTFNEDLEYGTYYELSVAGEDYTLLIDGPESRPLFLERAVFCPDGSAGVPLLTVLSLNSSLGATDSTTAFFDFYISHAAGAEINLASFMDSLSVQSSVLTFEYYGVDLYDGSQIPAPSPLPAADESILRVHLSITDSMLPGTVTLSLEEGLYDSFGNALTEDWSLSLSQP